MTGICTANTLFKAKKSEGSNANYKSLAKNKGKTRNKINNKGNKLKGVTGIT